MKIFLILFIISGCQTSCFKNCQRLNSIPSKLWIEKCINSENIQDFDDLEIVENICKKTLKQMACK